MKRNNIDNIIISLEKPFLKKNSLNEIENKKKLCSKKKQYIICKKKRKEKEGKK